MDPEIAKTQEERKKMEQQLASLTSLTFDTDLYGSNDRAGYVTSIPVNEEEDNLDAMDSEVARKLASYTAPKSLLKEMPRGGDEEEDIGFKKPQRIIDREDDYRRKRLSRVISPDRHDAFAAGDATPDISVRTYADVMREEALKREKEETLRAIAKKKKEEEENKAKGKESGAAVAAEQPSQKRRNRWDQSQDDGGAKKAKTAASSDWDMPDSTPGIGRWDATPTPGRVGDATPSLSRRNRWDETPTPGRLADSDATPAAGGVTPGATPSGMTWDATPKLAGLATPTPKRQRSRWDETPATMGSATPMAGATPAAAYTPGVTPVGGVDLATPTPGAINLRGAFTPEQYNLLRWEKDIEERNRPLTDEELDAMFPLEGYKILEPPPTYVPIRTPARKLLATPTPLGTPLYTIPEENRGQQFDVPKEAPGGLPFMKPEDYQYFGVLLNEEDEEELSPDEQKERKIMKLLLKVKNGTPPQRKTALRQLTDKAREFGAGPLFNRILPLLMQPTLEDQERHLLVKVIDRVLYKLDELVRPFVHKILVVIEPLLIDEDYYACGVQLPKQTQSKRQYNLQRERVECAMAARKRASSDTTTQQKSQETSSSSSISPDSPIAPSKAAQILKFSSLFFFVPYSYLVFYHYEIENELRRSILINAVLSFAGFFVTLRLIPVASAYVLRRNLFGYDINKKGTPQGTIKVPESLGIVIGIVFMVVAILFQYFNFTSDSIWLVEYNAALASICFMTLLGFVDDVLDVPWRVMDI